MKKFSRAIAVWLAAVLLLTACRIPDGNPKEGAGSILTDSVNPPAVSNRTTESAVDSPDITDRPLTLDPPVTAPPQTESSEPMDYPVWEGKEDIDLLATLDCRLGEVISLSAAGERLLITYLMEEYGEGGPRYVLAQELNLTTGKLSDAIPLATSDSRAILLENGRICVYNPLRYEIKLYDQNGKQTFSYTYKGEGGIWIDPSGQGTAWFYDWNSPTLTKVPLDGTGERKLDTPDGLIGYLAGQAGDLLCFTGWDEQGERTYTLDSRANDTASLSPTLLSGISGYSFSGNCFYREGDADRSSRVVSPADPTCAVDLIGLSFDWLLAGEGNCLLTETSHEKEGFTEYAVVDYRAGEVYPSLALSDGQRAVAFTFTDANTLCFAVYTDGEDGSASRLTLCRWNFAHDAETVTVEERNFDAILQENAAIAEKLQQTYGVRIIYGADRIAQVASDYSTRAVDDPETLHRHLLQLQAALEVYPAGFFDDLAYGEWTELEIYLCDTFTPLTSQGITTAQALSNTRGSVMVIGFDVNRMEGEYTEILAHELFHLMENRMALSEFDLLADWIALTPGGYDAYYFSYHDENGLEMNDPSHTIGGESDPAAVYFVDAYSKSFPTEDRARIFECLVQSGGNPTFADSPVLMEKARRLCQLIRETFPSVAAVERVSWEVER